MKKPKKIFPYIIAVGRWVLSLALVAAIALFVESAKENSVYVQHPMFMLICILLFGFLGFAANYMFKPVIIWLGGCPDRFFWQCIWAGIFQTMTMVTGLIVAFLVFAGLYFNRLPTIVRFYSDSPPSEANLIWVLWLGITLGIYLLEAWTKIPPAPPAQTRPALPKPQADPHGVQSFKNEVDQMLEKIKKNQ